MPRIITLQKDYGAIDYPWASNQLMRSTPEGYGLADPEQWRDKNGGVPFRFSVVYIAMTFAAGGLSVAAGAVQNAFTGGPGQASQGKPVALTAADTNALADGALVGDSFSYVIRHAACELLRPCTFDGATKVYSAGIDLYRTRIFEAFADNFIMRIKDKESECPKDLGPIRLWPTPSTKQGGSPQMPAFGAGIGPLMMMALRAPYRTGGQNSSEKAFVEVSSPDGFSIPADPNGDLVEGNYFQPIMVLLGGNKDFKICKPCVIPGSENVYDVNADVVMLGSGDA